MLNVTIYRDERDAILAKWNQLQAKWGVGKGEWGRGYLRRARARAVLMPIM